MQDGADFLVTITNDVWFGDSAAPYEHANMSRFRAVECRRPLVRCANTGISMLVSRTGKAERALGTFIPGSLRGKIVPENTTTLFVRAGHWAVAVAGLVLAGAFGYRRERR